jgi:glycosyltransferase involved in cell wall biosynthesis
MTVHQIVENMYEGDAISIDVLQIKKALKKHGINGEIYRNYCDVSHREITRHFSNYKPIIGEKMIFHYSIYSEAYEQLIETIDSEVLLCFHNVTPANFFPSTDKFRKDHIETTKHQIKTFSKKFVKAIADSEFNKRTLQDFGYSREIVVIPPFLDLIEKFGKTNSRRNISKNTKILSVSQLNYHKRQDDIVKSFLVYQKEFDPSANLYLVGSYYASSQMFSRVKNLSSGNSNIHILNKVSDSQLANLYQTSSLFISLSEHEGFGVPLVEAMHFQLPIIAYDAGAVKETMGKGGILIKEKNPLLVASTMYELINNTVLYKQIQKLQNAEIKKYNSIDIENRLLKCLKIN